MTPTNTRRTSAEGTVVPLRAKPTVTLVTPDTLPVLSPAALDALLALAADTYHRREARLAREQAAS